MVVVDCYYSVIAGLVALGNILDAKINNTSQIHACNLRSTLLDGRIYIF